MIRKSVSKIFCAEHYSLVRTQHFPHILNLIVHIVHYEFPEDVVSNRGLLLNIVTESYQRDCSDSIAYIADDLDYGVVVFDYARKSSYRIEHIYFYPFPAASSMTLNGLTYVTRDGIFGLALGKR